LNQNAPDAPNLADDWKSEVRDFCSRLERDYRDKVRPYAGGINCWGNSTTIGFEIPLGSGRVGRMWGDHAKYARRAGFLGLFGPRRGLRNLTDIDRQFRREIDEWLAKQDEPPSV